jgi:putative membrane protein
MNNEPERLTSGWKIFIIIVSIAIPVAVSAMSVIPKIEITSEGLRSLLNNLPMTYASINGLTFFILIGALVAIKKKKIILHQRLITFSMLMSIAFLLLYVIYHLTTDHTIFAGTPGERTVYLIILNSHILLSGIIVPLVLVAYARGVSMMVTKHRKIARIALPLWLYVAASGVVVYLMVRPYYPF